MARFGHLSLFCFMLSLNSFASAALLLNTARADTVVDPKDDPRNPLKYIANNTLTGIACSLIFVVGILQTWFIKKYHTKWMMPMTIGIFFFCFGLSLRFGLHVNPTSKILYAIQYFFVTLSPCGFIAADYILLGRLATHLATGDFLLLPQRRITVIFVSSDVITFLVQAGGGGITASASDPNTINLGSRIFLAGLIAQLISFAVFSVIYSNLLYRIHKHSHATWTIDQGKEWYNSWLALGGALVISCIGILIRSVFRVVELSEGFGGPLTKSEPFFYGLDTLPLFISIAVYIPFWPGRFIYVAPQFSSSRSTNGNREEEALHMNLIRG